MENYCEARASEAILGYWISFHHACGLQATDAFLPLLRNFHVCDKVQRQTSVCQQSESERNAQKDENAPLVLLRFTSQCHLQMALI